MTNQYVAIDVETANSDCGSICQIGLVAFLDGRICWEWSSLVNPECDFDRFNVKLHGIGSERVQKAPLWPTVLNAIWASISGQIVVSHSRFDCDALHHAAKRYAVDVPSCSWLDSCAIASVAWPDLPRHDLKSMCAHFGIKLHHHDAGSDARACGEILNKAIGETGMDTMAWIARVGLVSPPREIRPNPRTQRHYPEKIAARGLQGRPLSGHSWVCSGDFQLGAATLARMATSIGCDVTDKFTEDTTILVLGSRDPEQFAGKEKSNKLIAAEEAIASGRNITLMTEREFVELVNYYRRKIEEAASQAELAFAS